MTKVLKKVRSGQNTLEKPCLKVSYWWQRAAQLSQLYNQFAQRASFKSTLIFITAIRYTVELNRLIFYTTRQVGTTFLQKQVLSEDRPVLHMLTLASHNLAFTALGDYNGRNKERVVHTPVFEFSFLSPQKASPQDATRHSPFVSNLPGTVSLANSFLVSGVLPPTLG